VVHGVILGIGLDLVSVAEFRRIAESTARFRERVFRGEEIEFCSSRADPWPCLAARFAAKEAVMKALGTGWSQRVDFADIVILGGGERAPQVRLSGEAAARVQALGGRVHLSLTHAGGFAAAFAIVEQRSDPESPGSADLAFPRESR